MKINNADNFTHIIAKLLKGLNYEDVTEVNPAKEGVDIVASKDGVKYCFKCQYDIDAVGEKKVDALIKAFKAGRYDKAVLVTNSSFISAAKRKGESEGILLWDRNTVDRLSISISESLEDKVAPQGKRPAALVWGIVALAILLLVASGVYYFVFR